MSKTYVKEAKIIIKLLQNQTGKYKSKTNSDIDIDPLSLHLFKIYWKLAVSPYILPLVYIYAFYGIQYPGYFKKYFLNYFV